MSRYVLVAINKKGRVDAMDDVGYFLGEPRLFESIKDAMAFHAKHCWGKFYIKTVEEYERLKIQCIIEDKNEGGR